MRDVLKMDERQSIGFAKKATVEEEERKHRREINYPLLLTKGNEAGTLKDERVKQSCDYGKSTLGRGDGGCKYGKASLEN